MRRHGREERRASRSAESASAGADGSRRRRFMGVSFRVCIGFQFGASRRPPCGNARRCSSWYHLRSRGRRTGGRRTVGRARKNHRATVHCSRDCHVQRSIRDNHWSIKSVGRTRPHNILLMEPVSNPSCLVWQLGRGRPPGLSLVNQNNPYLTEREVRAT